MTAYDAGDHTDNNGNLRATVFSYGTGGSSPFASFNETFDYDGMNRLTGVVDNGGWSRYFGYDQHGNMWLCGWPGLPPNGSTPAATYCSQNSSSLFNGANQIAGNSYDAAGNLLSLAGSDFTYDAENRITGASQTGIGSMYYLYDGAGRRVQEVSTYNVEKVFVYDVFGQMAAEYSLGAQSLPCTTCYIATDHLGSARMVTDQNANVVGRHDYLPFGEEIAANTGGRNGAFGTQDFVNQKFTGQERDSETGLDFFQARYFSAALGRFNSPDPGNAGADLFNPQSWNAYTYAYNNPLTLIDPSGASPLDWFDPSPDDPCADDPFICGGPGFPDPDFPSPWPPEQPQAPPPPPPPPASIVIPHTGGSYAQGQWGSFPNDGETLGVPAGMTVPLPSPAVLLGLGSGMDCEFGVCGSVIFNATNSQGQQLGPTTGSITFSGIFPVLWGLVGPAVNFSWTPAQKRLCYGCGIGVSAGHTISGGPVIVHAKQGQTTKDVLGGFSLSGGYNWSIFRGAGGSVNFSGATAGYSMGIPGASGAITYSGCHVF